MVITTTSVHHLVRSQTVWLNLNVNGDLHSSHATLLAYETLIDLLHVPHLPSPEKRHSVLLPVGQASSRAVRSTYNGIAELSS